MSDMAQFVGHLNIERFLDRLHFERDPAVLASLRRLLLEEEDKLGFNLERLGRVQRYIAESRDRITRQKALIERLVAKGDDVRFAEGTLRNLVEIQRIYEQYRQVIVDAMHRNQRPLPA
jgi:hypothetical protein